MVAAGLLVLILGKPVDVQATTKKGEIVSGKAQLPDVKLKTAFGTAHIDGEAILSIEFGKPDVVVTKGDYELSGKLAFSGLKVGDRRLRKSELKSLVVGAAAGGTTFDGAWMLTFGRAQAPAAFKLTGTKLKGKYGHRGQFSIEGTVKGAKLSFTVREGNVTGKGEAELWKGGAFFLGAADYGQGDVAFGGYRKAARAALAKPGEVTAGQSEAGLRYFLRVPKDFDGTKKYPLIVITHGSNANSEGYVRTFPNQWPELAEKYIVAGVNGERLSPGSKPGAVGHNATYVNFSGPGVGQPWAARQTPQLLTETVRELKAALPVSKTFLGGHSQGGFLAYATFLYFPEDYEGAFPMACGLLVQCEPDRFDEGRREKQHRIAVAPIHGQADNVVAFSSGEYCYARLQESGFPRLRFFAPKGVGHGFMFLPVDDAIKWLDATTSEDPEALLAFAAAAVEDERWRDATGALARARELGASGGDAVETAVDAAAAKPAEKLLKAIRADKNNKWVEDFWEFRRDFAAAPAAKKVLKAYAKLQKKHQKKADELFGEARRANPAERKKLHGEIREKYYASTWWIIVRE